MPTEMTAKQAHALADRLSRRGVRTVGSEGPAPLAQQVDLLETEARTAGRLIRALLRQTHASDRWQLPEAPASLPDDGGS
jgi:hypothetical protein